MRLSATAALLLACVFLAPIAQGADLARGQALHDTFCVMCHESNVYTREHRLANSYLEIRQQVVRWHENARLRWSNYDIDSVTEYLAEKYYKIPY